MAVLRRLAVLILALLLGIFASAAAEDFIPLPMDSYEPGPAPKDSAYLSDTEYQDESIHVKIYQDRYADTDYIYAHIKISHPSQLRTAPATLAEKGISLSKVNFRYTAELTARGRYIANAANAVISINGDYFTKTDKCKVVLRQSQQVRNAADGTMDVLIIDKEGNFSSIRSCTRLEYTEYLDEHESEMYNVISFGPVLVQNGESVIGEDYYDGTLGSNKGTMRSAIAQLGPLEYMIITCSSPQASESIGKKVLDKGMTLQEFAKVCEISGKKLSDKGCLLAFNLDGGNSTTMNFKKYNSKTGSLSYVKLNPGQERYLSDIIYFATLVR